MSNQIIDNIRKVAKQNFASGKEINLEWRRVSWYREDGWNSDIKNILEKLGYEVIDNDDCINVLIEWKGSQSAGPP